VALTPLQQLYEQFNRLVDKPHEYNRLLASYIADIEGKVNANSVFWQDGICYSNDPSRGDLPLSTSRPVYTAGYYGQTITNSYLRVSGVTTAGDQGILMPRKGIITAAWAKSRSVGLWHLEVRRNNVPITLVSVPVVNSFGVDDQLTVDFNAGDWLQIYLYGTNVAHPIVSMEIAWTT